MGGLFKAPQPKIIATHSPAPAAAPVPAAPPPAAEAAASDARIESRDRATRGLPGTIATSARGLLDSMPDFVSTRRSLLGE
jgi:3-oxoacyl-ACP reductase-like protein